MTQLPVLALIIASINSAGLSLSMAWNTHVLPFWKKRSLVCMLTVPTLLLYASSWLHLDPSWSRVTVQLSLYHLHFHSALWDNLFHNPRLGTRNTSHKTRTTRAAWGKWSQKSQRACDCETYRVFFSNLVLIWVFLNQLPKFKWVVLIQGFETQRHCLFGLQIKWSNVGIARDKFSKLSKGLVACFSYWELNLNLLNLCRKLGC